MNSNGTIIRMESIRKVYDTGKVKVEALKGVHRLPNDLTERSHRNPR